VRHLRPHPYLLEAEQSSSRYRLLDYIYTAFHVAHVDGTPVLNPLFYKYPKDTNTFGRDLQFFYGDSILVSPATEENVTTVNAYIPKDTFYDWYTFAPVQGQGKEVTLTANFTTIPLHIKGGAVLPLRVKSAMTTTELRKTDFELVVAPGADGKASGALYADDGESITPAKTTSVSFTYKGGELKVKGDYGYALGVKLARVRVLGVGSKPKSVKVKYGGDTDKSAKFTYDATNKIVDIIVGKPFDGSFTVDLD
jgi:alpha-glucosidase